METSQKRNSKSFINQSDNNDLALDLKNMVSEKHEEINLQTAMDLDSISLKSMSENEMNFDAETGN
jgi:hypothetical protein